MEFYLDSADLKEIEEAHNYGIIDGLTTTPTFMHRHGITDIDGTILKLSKIVKVLQIEALGSTAEKIVSEAERLLALGLDKKKTVFKIPVSLEGVKACKLLRNKDILVNVHLVYTLQQAYLALAAGASYVCPLVGRLQDQGQDALALVSQCVDAVEYYGYKSKIMFSSVRHIEHVKNALEIGVHTCTMPWKVIKQLGENHLTKIGTDEFFEHTKLMALKVKDVLLNKKPTAKVTDTVMSGLVKISEGGYGAILIVDENNNLKGIFTDGDLRRLIQNEGEKFNSKKFSDIKFNNPITIDFKASLYDAQKIMSTNNIDNLVVLENNKPIGILDIQEILKAEL